MVVVVVGANDIIHPEVNLTGTRNNLTAIYKEASSKSDHVIAITTGNFRDVTFFMYPLNHYFGYRSKVVRNQAVSVAAHYENITFIDAFSERTTSPSIHALEATDHLHLNDLGAYYWFQQIMDATNNLEFGSA